MNKTHAKQIGKLISDYDFLSGKVQDFSNDIGDIKYSKQESFDEKSEKWQDSDAADEENTEIENLQEVEDLLDDAIESLETAKEKLNEALDKLNEL